MTVEEPVLHKTARPVTRFDAHLGELLDDMRQTLTNAGGVGLAAPQIGILRRVVVVDDDGELIELVNPEILETSGEQDGGKYAIKIMPDQIRFAKEIVTDGVLQEGFEIDKDDFYYYENKFKDVTVS